MSKTGGATIPNKSSAFPAYLAAQLADELNLPAGNLWEPAVAQSIERDLEKGLTEEQVELDLRIALFNEAFPTKCPECGDDLWLSAERDGYIVCGNRPKHFIYRVPKQVQGDEVEVYRLEGEEVQNVR